jgi:hypothetical protein
MAVTPCDPELYAKAKRYADRVYGKTTSAYRSMAIVKKYKQLGGKYSPKKEKSAEEGTTRWLREKWIMVQPYVKSGKIVKCGASQRRQHACRPSVRITSKTPITVQEAVKMHGDRKVIKLASTKKTNPNARVLWKDARVSDYFL